MTPFVRFVLGLLIVGAVVNLIIVMAANARNIQQQEVNRKNEMATFRGVLDVLTDSKPRRAAIAVESQEIASDGRATRVTRTTLIIRRQYQPGFDPAPTPEDDRLPLHRVVINGDQLHLDGLVLEFGPNFKVDVDGYEELRGRVLSYFAHVYGDGEWPAAQDNRFSFVNSPEPPELSRIYPNQDFPTIFERSLWLHIWDMVENPKWAQAADVKARYVEPAVMTMHNGHAYEAFLDSSGVTIREDNIPGRAQKLVEDAGAIREPK